MKAKTLRTRLKPHLWYQAYWVVYLIWFFWLDLTITDPKYIIHSPVDDLSLIHISGVEFPMTFTDKGNGHKVTVDADESFTNGVLWQQDAENFVCMEPWNGWANSVNEEGKHEVLEPDEAMTSEWTITIEKV